LGDACIDNADLGSDFNPCVWLQYEGARVIFNFGSQPWKYHFKLDSNYEKKIGTMKGPKLTPEESKRQSKAETIALVTQIDVRVCLMALVQFNDNIDRATEWVFVNKSSRNKNCV